MILVDEKRYEALEALHSILQYQCEVNPDDGLNFKIIGPALFEVEKNTSVLGTERNLIQQYERIAETEYLFRCALAEIANMDGEASLRARKALDEWYKAR